MLQSVIRAAKEFVRTTQIEVDVFHTACPYEVWVTTPPNQMEVGGQANNWLAQRGLRINQDYIFSWKMVPGTRDHYRFAFVLNQHAQLFRAHWQAYLVSHNN